MTDPNHDDPLDVERLRAALERWRATDPSTIQRQAVEASLFSLFERAVQSAERERERRCVAATPCEWRRRWEERGEPQIAKVADKWILDQADPSPHIAFCPGCGGRLA